MTTEYDSELEDAINGSGCDPADNDINVILRITPVLTFASGPAPGNNQELQKPINLEKVSTQIGHNHKQPTSWFSSDDNESKKGRAKHFKLDGPADSNSDLPVSPETSPTTGRTHKMFLIRSLSSSAAVPKEVSPKQARRLSDPTVPCQKSLMKSFEKQPSLKKLRPYLKRKAVSPLHLLGKKVAASTGSKHNNHDMHQNKEPKGGNKARLAKRLYPSFSKAYREQLAQKERRGSVPSGVPSEEDNCILANNYETMINDFSSQIQDLAVNLENLTATDHTARSELAVSAGNIKTNRGEPDARESQNNLGPFFKDDDIHLQEMLEDVLRSHLLTMDDYSPASCDRASRSICKIVTRLLGGGDREKRPGDGQRKLACLVYIGAVRDSGIEMAAQALWCPDEDSFAAASFRNESMYGFAVVIATPN